jgi:hypothetical protein
VEDSLAGRNPSYLAGNLKAVMYLTKEHEISAHIKVAASVMKMESGLYVIFTIKQAYYAVPKYVCTK